MFKAVFCSSTIMLFLTFLGGGQIHHTSVVKVKVILTIMLFLTFLGGGQIHHTSIVKVKVIINHKSLSFRLGKVWLTM